MFSPSSFNVTITCVKTQVFTSPEGHSAIFGTSSKATTEGHAFHMKLSTACTSDVLHDAEQLGSYENVKPSLDPSMFIILGKKEAKSSEPMMMAGQHFPCNNVPFLLAVL